MGSYLNPSNDTFLETYEDDVFVDKSLLIGFTNSCIKKNGKKNICVSRPRRFGKSVNLEMLSAYYSRGCDSRKIFENLKIAQTNDWDKNLNQFNVIRIDMQALLKNNSRKNMFEILYLLQQNLLWELTNVFSNIKVFDKNCLSDVMSAIYKQYNIPFVILIDEWDCIFREYRDDKDAQKEYLDFLCGWLKGQNYVALCYMTGILPIKKYGTHSALNMFREYSMVSSNLTAEYTGFTEDEVVELCNKFNMDIHEMKRWYDGYVLNNIKLYCSHSIAKTIQRKKFNNYWARTETYEALEKYIVYDFLGLREKINLLLVGEQVPIKVTSFQNDMTSMKSTDDILTLLVHLGYLSYIKETKKAYIPNKEVRDEFVLAMEESGKWEKSMKFIQNSEQLLKDTLALRADKVAERIEEIHREDCEPSLYNNEQALRHVVLMAYFYAREKYTIIQETPAGNGYADITLIPYANNPNGVPVVIELKYNYSAESAIEQIKNKHYSDVLKGYEKVLLVGISYDKESNDKKHHCVIEEYTTK